MIVENFSERTERIEPPELEHIVREEDADGMRWYHVGGVPHISVTQVLDCFVPPQLKKWFINNSAKKIENTKTTTAAKGSEIHEAVKNGTDDRYNVLAEKMGWQTLNSEFVVYSKNGFAGQADKMVLTGSKGTPFGDKRYIIDVKTGRFGPSAGAQLGAYSLASNEKGIAVDGIGVVSIPRDGGEAKWFDYSAHMEECQYAFCCALDFWKFQNYKKLEAWPFMGLRTTQQYIWSPK